MSECKLQIGRTEGTYQGCSFEPLRGTYRVPYAHSVHHLVLSSRISDYTIPSSLRLLRESPLRVRASGGALGEVEPGGSKQGRTYRISLLDEALIVPAERDEEQDSRDILKTMDPLASLGFLATDVDHHQPLPGRTGHRKVHLVDTHCARTGENNVLYVCGVCVPGGATNRVSISGNWVGWETEDGRGVMTQQGGTHIR